MGISFCRHKIQDYSLSSQRIQLLYKIGKFKMSASTWIHLPYTVRTQRSWKTCVFYHLLCITHSLYPMQLVPNLRDSQSFLFFDLFSDCQIVLKEIILPCILMPHLFMEYTFLGLVVTSDSCERTIILYDSYFHFVAENNPCFITTY